MARDSYAYRDVAVESVIDPRSGLLRIRPMAGQAFAPSLRVQCGQAMRDSALYPAGTPFLYVYHGDPVVVLTAAQAKKFLLEFRRGRI